MTADALATLDALVSGDAAGAQDDRWREAGRAVPALLAHIREQHRQLVRQGNSYAKARDEAADLRARLAEEQETLAQTMAAAHAAGIGERDDVATYICKLVEVARAARACFTPSDALRRALEELDDKEAAP